MTLQSTIYKRNSKLKNRKVTKKGDEDKAHIPFWMVMVMVVGLSSLVGLGVIPESMTNSPFEEFSFFLVLVLSNIITATLFNIMLIVEWYMRDNESH